MREEREREIKRDWNRECVFREGKEKYAETDRETEEMGEESNREK